MSKRKQGGFKLIGNRKLSLPWLFGILGACFLLSYGFAALTGTLSTKEPDSAQLTATQEANLQKTEVAVAFLTATVETWTPSPSPTNTPAPTNTSRPTATRLPPTSTPRPITWYVTGAENVNVRSCGSGDCEIVDTLAYGDEIQVISTENDWHKIIRPNGATAYVAAWLTSRTRPAAQTFPTAPPAQQQPTVPPQQQQPTAPPASTWNCSGDIYNCSDFTTCAEAIDYFRACPGDPSDLDGDGNGVPCKSLCGR